MHQMSLPHVGMLSNLSLYMSCLFYHSLCEFICLYSLMFFIFLLFLWNRLRLLALFDFLLPLLRWSLTHEWTVWKKILSYVKTEKIFTVYVLSSHKSVLIFDCYIFISLSFLKKCIWLWLKLDHLKLKYKNIKLRPKLCHVYQLLSFLASIFNQHFPKIVRLRMLIHLTEGEIPC